MNKEQTIKVINELVMEFSNEKTEDLKGKNLVEDLGYDSVSLMQLIAELEEKLGISIEADAMLDSFDNYDSLVESILELMNDDVQ